MADLVKAEMTQIGEIKPIFEKNKIDDYGLGEEVLNLHFQEFKPFSIAKRCNEILKARPPDEKYIEVNCANVISYVKMRQKQYELSKDPNETQIAKVNTNIADKISSVVTLIESELSKLRNPDGPIKESQVELLTTLLTEFRKNNELMASIQGKLQPSISYANFTASVERFVKFIGSSTNLTEEARNYVMDNAINMLVNDDIFKSANEKK